MIEVFCNLGDSLLDEAAAMVIRRAAASAVWSAGAPVDEPSGRIVMSYSTRDASGEDILILLYRGEAVPLCSAPKCGVLRSPYPIEELEMLVRTLVRAEMEKNSRCSDGEGDLSAEGRKAEPVVRGRTVTLGDLTVTLTKKEAAIFSILYMNRGTSVSRERLTEEVWGGETRTNLCDVYVCRLRTALEPVFGKGFLVNIRNEGYRML